MKAALNAFVRLFQAEPALVISVATGVVDAGLIVAVSFGLPLQPVQKQAIDTFLGAGLAFVGLLVAGVAIRSQVSPAVDVGPLASPPAPAAQPASPLG